MDQQQHSEPVRHWVWGFNSSERSYGDSLWRKVGLDSKSFTERFLCIVSGRMEAQASQGNCLLLLSYAAMPQQASNVMSKVIINANAWSRSAMPHHKLTAAEAV